MAEARRYVPVLSLNLDEILEEAQHRWLRPTEICEILRNHKKFVLKPEPPCRPPAGSLFLFDRKVLRYFRKDGHRWRKKKDGKTVKEAHEKLKAGSVDVLHCYYAHGEDNENFQRRSYWMLDQELDNIVLVHYREVKGGSKLGVSHFLNADTGSQLESPQTSSAPSSEQINSPTTTVQASYASTLSAIDWREQRFYEFQGGDSGEGQGVSSLRPASASMCLDTSVLADDAATGLLELPNSHLGPNLVGACFSSGAGSSTWDNNHNQSGDVNSVCKQKLYFEQMSATNFLTGKLTDARLDADSTTRNIVSCGDRSILDATNIVKVAAQGDGADSSEAAGLKKLDSFGRWMDKELGGDCDNSLMDSNSGNYWNALDTGTEDKEVSSLLHHVQLDIDSLAPSLSQEQLFSIGDFAPEWAYSGVETKVLIIGTFLGDKNHCSDLKWCCMFGEIEASAEVIGDNVIRCQVPFHSPARVPFYITCSNRLACSEVREFEYREKISGVASLMAVKTASKDEVCLQIRLAKILYMGPERKWLDCSIVDCDRCKLKKHLVDTWQIQSKNCWEKLDENINSRDVLIRNLLKERLYEWLACKLHEVGKGPLVLDNQGQGVIHLAAALGYDWAIEPIVAAGVTPNFRDTKGRTALHWASYYGREEMVIALIRLGVAPGAVDDPRPVFPGGQTAADLASARGHKGISGYLAEEDLVSHLRSLNVEENPIYSTAANFAAESAMKTAAQTVITSDREIEVEVSLRGSLAAVRKSAHAAALIEAAFRDRSFHQRQWARSSNDISETALDLIALGSLNKVQKMSHFEDYLHFAAIKIQQKYRGWKRRKEFLKIRNRIVQIQAHVRGYQVRKQYKNVVWSVSILEKAILRWRRKGQGLRGFRREKTTEHVVPQINKNDEYEFLQIGRDQKRAGVEKALARVQSMARHPEARDQYMRLVTRFESLKLARQDA